MTPALNSLIGKTRPARLLVVILVVAAVAVGCSEQEASEIAAEVIATTALPVAQPTNTPTPTAVPQPSPTATPTPTAVPASTATPVPTATAAPEATATPTPSPTPEATIPIELVCLELQSVEPFMVPLPCEVTNSGPATTVIWEVSISVGEARAYPSGGTIDLGTDETLPLPGMFFPGPGTGFFSVFVEVDLGSQEAEVPIVLDRPAGPPPLGWLRNDPPNDPFHSATDMQDIFYDPAADILSQGNLITAAHLAAAADLFGPGAPFECGAPNDFGFSVFCGDEAPGALIGGDDVFFGWTCNQDPIPVSGDRFRTHWALFDDGDPANDFQALPQFANDPLGGTDTQIWLDYDPASKTWFVQRTHGPNLEFAPSGAVGFIAGRCAGFGIPFGELPPVDDFGFGMATFSGPPGNPFGSQASLDRLPDPQQPLGASERCPIFVDGFESGDTSVWSTCP